MSADLFHRGAIQSHPCLYARHASFYLYLLRPGTPKKLSYMHNLSRPSPHPGLVRGLKPAAGHTAPPSTSGRCRCGKQRLVVGDEEAGHAAHGLGGRARPGGPRTAWGAPKLRGVSAGCFSLGARHSGSTTDPMGGAAVADGGMAHGSADPPTAARWGAEISSMSAPQR
jgi:hypothetical protein